MSSRISSARESVEAEASVVFKPFTQKSIINYKGYLLHRSLHSSPQSYHIQKLHAQPSSLVHITTSPTSDLFLLPLDLLIQFTRQTATRSPLLAHPRARARLHAEDTVLSRRLGRNRDRPPTAVLSRGATRRAGEAAAPDILDGCRGVGVHSLGAGAAVVFLGVAGRRVSPVEARVLSQELVVGGVGFVAGAYETMDV
jgi:hypothetical protein